ncbi:hypothetical protein SCHPADRAFT_948223 [Schizopora paradoxa]|uniref:Uncharacterized protein n=1 Tax=Schizopora paradoxa TaxID=27342 RepID=A0A0H2RG17_9AGAM|nr:hypothetical protein SCHPADRAFT_948223 [Schizopora paradoxa]
MSGRRDQSLVPCDRNVFRRARVTSNVQGEGEKLRGDNTTFKATFDALNNARVGSGFDDHSLSGQALLSINSAARESTMNDRGDLDGGGPHTGDVSHTMETNQASQDINRTPDGGRDDTQVALGNESVLRVHAALLSFDHRLLEQIGAVDEQLKILDESLKEGQSGQVFLQQLNLNFSRHQLNLVINEISEVDVFDDTFSEMLKDMIIKRAKEYVALIESRRSTLSDALLDRPWC